MKIATWNVNSLRVRLEHLARWAPEAQPDVLCMQETKVEDAKFPHAELEALGFVHRAIYGQKTYNGVAIVSKFPLEDVIYGFQVGDADEQARLVRATVGGIRIFSCYIPNGSSVGSDKFRYKLGWLARLRGELDAGETPDRPLVLCGDFNIAPAETDVWDPFEAENEILFHPLEHKALSHLTAWGLTDALRVVQPAGQAFTWWDYRGGGFRRNMGFRIDHHWVTASLAQRLIRVHTWRDVRGWEQPSDHVPVLAEYRE